jgi:hypothetical protein
MDRNELSLDPRHIGGQSDASKIISDPMVRSAQTEHQSRVEIDTIPKQKMSLHLTCVTQEYPLVCLKRF